MNLLFARALSTLEPPLRGIHLMWTGPARFLFAPGGWEVERRPAGPFLSQGPACDEVFGPSLARLRSRLELRLSLGWMRLSPGSWNGPEPGPCEVFTLELDRPATGVSGVYRGRHGLAIGLNRGKAVAYQFLPLANDGRRFDFGAAPVEEVVVYGLHADAVRCCVAAPPLWPGGTVVARLHLPLREFVPALADAEGELAEANRRLAPGETIDPARFKELADILRVALRGPGRRPIDSLLRMQGESEGPEQMFALDPLRTLVASPKWRRVMGLGWLDRDPALTPGDSYDYRITGMFPVAERDARVFGFHTIPPGTALPADFSLEDCRLRLPEPVTVEAAPSIPATGAQWATRSGIRLAPRGGLPWFGLGIEDASAAIELPAPVSRLILELDSGHQLRIRAGHPGGPFGPEQPVPPGGLLEFAAPVTQVNLFGKGFLFAVRIPGLEVDRMVPISAILAGVRFDESPRPDPPSSVTIANLQTPPGPSLTSQPSIRTMHQLGFDVRWRPAPAAGLPFWPSDFPVPPPLDATMFQVERRLEPAGPFAPVLASEDNAMFGSRGEPVADRTIVPGMDLMRVFPEEARPRRGRSDEFTYPDVFRAPDEDNPQRRAPPPPGSVLRYRVRTLDVIGRPSLDWRESNSARLEKHDPPPPPAAFDPTPADELTKPGPTGVYARILVRGSDDLTADETALLGSSDNAILLRWGWRAPERTQDPFARQFRVYLSSTFDLLPGEILSVAEVTPGDWELSVRVPRALDANASTGLFLSAGYPFFIVQHTVGTLVTMLVRTRIPDANGAFRKPLLGPVGVPLKLAPTLTQPRTWSERLVFPSGHAHVPVTAGEQYEAVIRDRLLLTPEHPRDALWLGVTAADSESYVDDTFPDPGPDGPLPGNESPVVAVLCQARRAVRPEFHPPPPAGPVPRVLSPEPAAGPVHFALDLSPFLDGSGLAAGEPTQPERASLSAVFAALAVSGGQLLALVVNRRDPGEADLPITLANPADHAAVVAAVEAGSSADLEDRLAVRLAAMHPYADRLFQQATAAAIPFGPFDETLPPTDERYLYRFRRADSTQRLSVSAALASAVVRVPSLAPGPSPRRAPRQPSDSPRRLRLRIPLDRRLEHLLTFEHPVVEGPFSGEAEVLRVPNRPELSPGAAIRLRLPDGTVLAPSSQPLGPPPVDAQGWLVAVDSSGPAGARMMVWASTLTSDGAPSPPGGPWRLAIPKPDLVPSLLSVAVSPSTLTFSWTLPEPLVTSLWLEASADGVLWERASSVRRPPLTSLDVRRGPALRQFRLVGSAQDGRRATSNPVTA